MCRLSWNLGVSFSWNPQGLSRPVMGLLNRYLYYILFGEMRIKGILYIYIYIELLTLFLLMWRIWWAPNNASKWQMRFYSALKGLKMIVGVLTTCHTQYTWDRYICIFLFNRTTLQVFVTYLTGALYVHPLWFYKHQHGNRVRSTQNAFSLLFAVILVNCAPSGEVHNYCTPHIIKENFENFLIHRCNYILLSQVLLSMTSC